MSADHSQDSQSKGRLSRLSFGDRRDFLKVTTTGLGTVLAGCAGGGGDGGGGGSDTTTQGGGGGGTTTGDQGPQFSGVSITYWDVMNVQSQTASERVQQFVSDFQKDTGATVKLNMSGYSQMSGQKWVQAWRNNNYPVAFNCEDFYFGRIIPTGNLKPFDSYKSNIADEAIDGMQWAMDLKKEAYRFWDIPGETGIINFPHAAGIRNPLTVRADKLQQAGASVDDIPDTGDAVKDFEQLMQLAQTVQQNSDVQWGYHGHAAWPDYNDNTAPWMSAQNVDKSRYISPDGKTPYPSDTWAPWIQRYQDMVHKYGVSGPQTATISDEQIANMMYAGDVAMANVEPLNYPTFIRRAPNLLQNGDLRFLPYPGGNSGKPGHIGFHDSGINDKPPNADAKRWERKTQVAYALLNELMGEQFQTGYPNMVGWVGSRKDLWGKANAKYTEQTGFMNAVTTMMENANMTWPYHRYSNAIIFRTIAPYIQQAINQETSPADAMAQARKESKADIQAAIDELGEPGTWPIS